MNGLTRWTKRARLLPLTVFGLAALSRLWQIDLARFEDDQATLLGSAAHFVTSHQLPLTTGMSFTIGIRHPPLATFLLTPPALVGHNPVIAAAYVALLDAVGALFVYWAGAALAGPAAGAIGGLVYALEPAAVVYGRTIWNPDFVPLCAAIALWGLLEFWRRDRAWGQAAALFAIGCAAQLHPQASALIAVWLVVALARRRVGWPTGVALLGLGLVLAPYLYLQVGSGWPDVAAAWRYLEQTKTLDGQAFVAVGSLFSGRPYWELLEPRGAAPGLSSFDPLLWLLAAGLLGGLALVFGRRRPAELVVAGFFVAPLLAALDHSGEVEPHYLLVLLPSGCLLIGLLAQTLLADDGGKLDGLPYAPAAAATIGAQQRWRLWLAWGFAGVTLAVSLMDWVVFQREIPEAVGANYGVPMRYSVEAADRAATFGGALYVSNLDADAGVFAYLAGQQKRFDGRYTLVLPRAAGTYLADASLPFAYAWLSQTAQRLGEITTPGGRSVYGLFAAPGGDLSAEQQRGGERPLDVDVGHAVQLLGYTAADLRSGAPSTVELVWRVTDAHAGIPADLRQFAHLVDATGRLWSSNPDFRGYPRTYWQPGDSVVSAFDLDLPANIPSGGYWLETGFYEPISGQRVPQYHAGQPSGTSARIGPLKVSGISPPAGDEQPLATFGSGQIALLGVRRTANGVMLRWQALKKPAADYTVFVHVLDAQGRLVAQHDGQPRGGSYPTHLWDAGEVVDDDHPLVLSSQSGQRLEVGLYTTPDVRRLPVDEAGTDSVVLTAPNS